MYTVMQDPDAPHQLHKTGRSELEREHSLVSAYAKSSGRGKYDAALQSASGAYRVHQAVSGELARETLRSLSLRGKLLSRQGKFRAAEEVLRRALDGYDKASIPNDEERMNCIGHLSDALQSQGN